jgi:hypothetical protein
VASRLDAGARYSSAVIADTAFRTMKSSRRSIVRSLVAGLAGLALAALAGCTPETKVTHYRPFFTGVGGAEFSTEPVNPNKDFVDPTQVGPEAKLVTEHDDGSKTYIARSPRHVMAHLETILDENSEMGDQELLDQLISDKTKQHYREQGKDPMEFVADLRNARKDIAKFFARMPMGEQSPTVLIDQPGDNIWVVRLTGAATKGLRFTKLWVRLEGVQWKLMWLK